MSEKLLVTYGDVDYESLDLVDRTIISFDCVGCEDKARVSWRSFKRDRRLLCPRCKRNATNVARYGSGTWGEAMKKTHNVNL